LGKAKTKAVDDYIWDNLQFNIMVFGPSALGAFGSEDAVRACAQGNPAACPN
jgi:hypothetical protein